MVFSSQLFIFGFLPPALVVYYLAGKVSGRARNLVLALAGYVFYGWAQPRFLPLMWGTTLVDWTLSLIIAGDSWQVWRLRGKCLEPLPKVVGEIQRTRVQKWAVALSVISNMAMLGYFKYFNFAVDSMTELAGKLGMGQLEATHFLRVALPLGISFYTFQSLSYIIDVYRGDARPMRNFIDFACFVSMFPHLVAGPILKFSFLADQLENRTMTFEKFGRGVAFFSLGLAKKVLLANTCATIADATFGAGSLAPLEAWWGAVAYAFQIYFDFSGYSDMAIGLGLMLGFVFARNFDAPYRAHSVTDFWRRWHISLSTWLREYLYIPLGGNRLGPGRTYFNLLVTMLLGGLWHGASWNFVIWGGLQGGALAFERLRSGRTPLLPRWLAPPATFAFVLLSWVFFRTENLPQAIHYLAAMMGATSPSQSAALLPALVYAPLQVLGVAVAVLVVWGAPDSWEWSQCLTWSKSAFCLTLFWSTLVLLATQTYQPFIYFVF